jgi:hypothetical protein
MLPSTDACRRLLPLLSPLLSAQLNESFGLWAQRTASTGSISAGASRRMSSRPAVHDQAARICLVSGTGAVVRCWLVTP